MDLHLFIYPAYFLGGGFFANAIPHLINGVSGRSFQTPFADPPGKGLSSSTINVLWGFANLVIAWLLVFCVGSFELRKFQHAAVLGAGMLLMFIMSARVFGPFHGGR